MPGYLKQCHSQKGTKPTFLLSCPQCLLTLSHSCRDNFIVLPRLGAGSLLLSAPANSPALLSSVLALLPAIHGER